MGVTPPIGRKRQVVGRPGIRLLAVVLALAGLTLQGFLPGLDLGFRGDLSRTWFGASSDICHASPSGRTTPVTDSVPADPHGPRAEHACCLMCQAAGDSQIAGPPQDAHIPEWSQASPGMARLWSGPIATNEIGQNPARAPPSASA